LRLGQELLLLATGLALVFWLGALLGYSGQDPGYSTTGAGAAVQHPMGYVGAWLADMCYFFFGLSAWWLPLAGGRVWLAWLVQWLRGSGAQEVAPLHRVRAPAAVALLLVASCSLEWARLHHLDAWLPGLSGGVLGQMLGPWALRWLGFDGAALLGIGALLLGMALVFGFSWARLAEGLGALLDGALRWSQGLWRTQARASVLHDDGPMGPIDVHQYMPPPLELLDASAPPRAVDHAAQDMTARLIEKRLKDFGVAVQVLDIVGGPVVTRYDIEPASGVRGAALARVIPDLKRSLGLKAIRLLESVPGKTCMGLELPKHEREGIALRQVLASDAWQQQDESALTLGLGLDTEGRAVVADLVDMPHLLVAGGTGSGKSVGLHAMIISLLYKACARDLRLLLIDPKLVELSRYEGIAHLLCPVVTDVQQAVHALNWCVGEMQRRYALLAAQGVPHLAAYNAAARASGTPPLAHIVVVIDELADLMLSIGKPVEVAITRLAQKARAAGIHLILATQRPSANVITGLIKANMPTRIAFAVSSNLDSRIVLDQNGAEALLGAGDMLLLRRGASALERVHGAFVSSSEVARIVGHLRAQSAPDYVDAVLHDTAAN